MPSHRHLSSRPVVVYAPDFYILQHLRAVNAGDVIVVPGDPETSFERCRARVDQIVAAGAVPLVCGGDHAITLPVVRAVAGRLSGRLGLIHFDTQYDLAWDPKYDDRVGTGSHPAARLFVEIMAAMAWRRRA